MTTDDERQIQTCLLAIEAVEATRGVVLTATEQVFVARIRLWAHASDSQGRRGQRLLTMTSANTAAFEALVRGRTGKSVGAFAPILREIPGVLE